MGEEILREEKTKEGMKRVLRKLVLLARLSTVYEKGRNFGEIWPFWLLEQKQKPVLRYYFHFFVKLLNEIELGRFKVVDGRYISSTAKICPFLYCPTNKWMFGCLVICFSKNLLGQTWFWAVSKQLMSRNPLINWVKRLNQLDAMKSAQPWWKLHK